MTRELWLEQRKQGIGGSDAAAIIGCSPYMSNQELYRIKTGEMQPKDLSDEPVIKYGNKAEPLLRAMFALDYPNYDVHYEEFKIYKNKEYPFIQGSLDGILTEKATGKKGVLEIKTALINSSLQGDNWKDKLPKNYYIQVLHYLLVTGFDFAIVYAKLNYDSFYYKDVKKICTYWIEAESVKEDLEMLKQAEIDFWQNNVLQKKCPPTILPPI